MKPSRMPRPAFGRAKAACAALLIAAFLPAFSGQAQVIMDPAAISGPDPAAAPGISAPMLPTAPNAPGPFAPPAASPPLLSEQVPEAQLDAPSDIERLFPLWPIYLTVGLLVLIALIALIVRQLRKRRSVPPPPIPADIAALDALSALRNLIDQAQAREYAYRASEIIRLYVEKRFDLNAPRQTTREFLETLSRKHGLLPDGERPALEAFLAYCDLAKFARQALSPAELSSMHATATRFIQQTRPALMASSGPNPAPAKQELRS
jgi:hypothetical protein